MDLVPAGSLVYALLSFAALRNDRYEREGRIKKKNSLTVSLFLIAWWRERERGRLQCWKGRASTLIHPSSSLGSGEMDIFDDMPFFFFFFLSYSLLRVAIFGSGWWFGSCRCTRCVFTSYLAFACTFFLVWFMSISRPNTVPRTYRIPSHVTTLYPSIPTYPPTSLSPRSLSRDIFPFSGTLL